MDELNSKQEDQLLEEARETNFAEKLIIPEARESLKLFKNTKGYNWEIKTLDIDINRLVKLNNELKEQFGEI